MVLFFAHFNRTMYYTLCGVAERARLGHKEPERFLTNPGFWAEFTTKTMDANIKPCKSVGKVQKALFKLCHQLVKEWNAANGPDNVRHADLAALFIFNFWNATGLLPMTQALVIDNSER